MMSGENAEGVTVFAKYDPVSKTELEAVVIDRKTVYVHEWLGKEYDAQILSLELEPSMMQPRIVIRGYNDYASLEIQSHERQPL